MEREEAIEILERMKSRIADDPKWLALDTAINALEGQEIKKNVVNVIPQECMKILSDAVMEAIRSIDWITLGEKMSERPPVEERRAHWLVRDGYPHRVYCSLCNITFCDTKWKVWKDGSLPRAYCPNCGAKMEET